VCNVEEDVDHMYADDEGFLSSYQKCHHEGDKLGKQPHHEEENDDYDYDHQHHHLNRQHHNSSSSPNNSKLMSHHQGGVAWQSNHHLSKSLEVDKRL
jgi:hypothetical protein